MSKEPESYTLEDYLKSLYEDSNENKDADFIVLQKEIRQRQREDIIKIGDQLTVNGMQPPIVFGFLHYFLFFWDHIEPFLKDDEDKRFIKLVIKDILDGNRPEAEKLRTH